MLAKGHVTFQKISFNGYSWNLCDLDMHWKDVLVKVSKTLSFPQANLLSLGLFFSPLDLVIICLAVTLSSFLPVNASYFASHALGARFEGEKKGGVGEGKAALF